MNSLRLSPDALQEQTRRALELPLLRRTGYSLLDQSEARARGAVHVSAELGGPSGQLNGTDIYGLVDCTAWFAVVTVLGPEEAAVSHDAHFSLLGAAPVGSDVTFEARVMKRGRTTAFLRVEGHVDGKPIVSATITKTILPISIRQRHAPKQP
jgi:acyl-coenzyme A thioesterase 13